MMKKIILFFSFVITAALLTGCSGKEDQAPITTEVKDSLPSHFFTTERPANVNDLVAVKKDAKAGDQVTFLARIGGRKQGTFVSTLSMMIVADPNLLSCELMADDDHCDTPEDYCCEDPMALTQGLGTIRFMKNETETFPFSVESEGGMEILKYVVVKGKVHDINENGLFIVDAEKVWVGGAPSYGNNRTGSGE